MKLRNKKTGEVFDALIREKGSGGSYSLIVCDIKAYEHSKNTLDETHFILDDYDSLAELNEEWEDYVPTEPLIKDEKVRKAVIAWAEANNILQAKYVRQDTDVVFDHAAHSLTWINTSIEFNEITALENLEDGKRYTIAELCGEEKE